MDIVRLVEQQVERVLATDPGHAIRVTTAGVCPWLSLDPLRIEQVIGNLLSNASKYSDANSEILVTIEARASEVEVAVTNRGPGIPAEELSQLFTRFYRTRSARSGRVRGIGLGLYLCKSLVEAHGGVIDANSLTGETTFRFTLPSAESVSPSA